MLPTSSWRAVVAAAGTPSSPTPDTRAAASLTPPSPKGLALAAAQRDETPGGQSTFAFTVPDNGNTDVFFAMRVSVENSWAAVGLGSDDMKGALFLMLYRNYAGDNVTFSPRLAYANYEPQHYDELRYEVLPGTGVVDGHMVFVAKCTDHCRSWPAADSNSGYIDVSSPNQKAIYAPGPRERFDSDSPDAALKFHREYGVFTIDMKRTQGSPDAPVLDAGSKSVGTSLDYRRSGKVDYKAGLHGAFMVLFVVVLLPLGVIMLHLGRWASWHGVNQAIGVAGVLAGLALGVLTSFHYQRVRMASTPCPRAVADGRGRRLVSRLPLLSPNIRLRHRRLHPRSIHARRPAPPKVSQNQGADQVWPSPPMAGKGCPLPRPAQRLLVRMSRRPRGSALTGTRSGFSFAQNHKYGLVLVGLLLIGAFSLLWLSVGQRMRLEKRAGDPLADAATGYQPQPWRERSGPSGATYPSEPPPGYEPPSQQIGLQSVSPSPAAPSPWKTSDAKDYEDHPALESAQRPREFA